MKSQLALNIALGDSASFANFLSGANGEPVHRLEQNLAALRSDRAASDPVVFIAGASGTGKTHLLQALCRAAQERGVERFYAPLAEHATLGPAVLEFTEPPSVVCLDDVDRIAGDLAWEQSVRVLWERVRADRGLLVVAARAVPASLTFRLPDVASRLGAGPVYTLVPLGDTEKAAAIRLRANNRGFSIADEVVRYIVKRYPRDLHSLFALLDRLDVQSLASQRRITIPFLRELEKR